MRTEADPDTGRTQHARLVRSAMGGVAPVAATARATAWRQRLKRRRQRCGRYPGPVRPAPLRAEDDGGFNLANPVPQKALEKEFGDKVRSPTPTTCPSQKRLPRSSSARSTRERPLVDAVGLADISTTSARTIQTLAASPMGPRESAQERPGSLGQSTA